MADADVPVNRPSRAASTQASTEAAAALQSVGAEATRDAAGSIAAKEAAAAAASPSNRASVTNGAPANGAAADGARGSVAGRATSPSSAGGDKTGAAAADATAAPAAEEKRGSTITAANGTDATRAATVTDRSASGSVSGDVKQAERAPTQQPLAAVAEEPAPARASVSKASPVPPAADQPSAAAPAASNGANGNGNGADLSKAVTPNNGGGTAQTNAALKDRAEKKDQLAGGDKDITKPRPIEDVKRELEQGSRRCTDAWNGKADAFSGLKPEDGTVRYMGFVLLDGDQKAALFHVDGGKTGPAAATAKAEDKAFRLLKLSELVDSKEEVKLMYTSSPIVLASAAGKGEVVKALVDRFGVDPQHPQTIYTAAFDKEQKKWVVDNSQGRRVSAGEVALANGFEDVAATGGCRMCAGGDCTLM